MGLVVLADVSLKQEEWWPVFFDGPVFAKADGENEGGGTVQCREGARFWAWALLTFLSIILFLSLSL